jgi:hypothetical protein
MDGGVSRGFSGGGLPPCPAVAPTRRRAFVAPHPRPTSTPLDSNLPGTQERPSPDGGGGNMPSPGGGGGRMPSPGGGGSGLPPRLPNDPPRLGPHALTFTEPHAAT